MKKLTFVDVGTNPGFEIGQVVYWDEEKIPLDKQPRPFIGKIFDMTDVGCGMTCQYTEGEIWHSWLYLCTYGLVE